MAGTLLSTLDRIVPLLAPATRLKLLAFVQLLDCPEAVRADLAVESGALRLTLAGGVANGASAPTETPRA